MNGAKEFFEYLLNQVKNITIIDVIDILLVSVLIYYFYKFIKGRRAGKLAIGLLLFFALLFVSSIAEMQAMYFLLRNFVQVGLLAIIIVFQPELRSMLEQMGAQPMKNFNRFTSASQKADLEKAIDSICDAAAEFSLKRTGALIVLERETKLGDVIKTGTVVNAECTLFLIRNIFFDKAPLHDGAIIVRDGRIHAAGCFLPLSSQDIDQNLGTRHRAGLGMSENSDAMVIIISEETGNITLAQYGTLKKCNNIAKLKKELRGAILPEGDEKNVKSFTDKLFRKHKNSGDKTNYNDNEK